MGATATTFGVSGLAAAAPDSEEISTSDAADREVAAVVESESFEEARRQYYRDTGDSLRDLLDFGRAAALRRRGESGFALAVPLKSDGRFSAESTATGLRARVRNQNVDVLFNAGGDDAPDAMNTTSKTTDVVANANCRYDIPGWNCDGVYDSEEICKVIAFANAFILANDATGIGFVDDILLPATVIAAKGCVAEQFVELVVTDWLNGCSTDNWVYEYYVSAWWNPIGSVAAPKCG